MSIEVESMVTFMEFGIADHLPCLNIKSKCKNEHIHIRISTYRESEGPQNFTLSGDGGSPLHGE